MELIGYVVSLLIGVSLGLIGAGGSILTVPLLVYIFHVNPVEATAYSLFIVGATSLVGSFPKYRKGDINLKTAAIFGIPSIAAIYSTRAFLIPAIPHTIIAIGEFELTKSLLLLLLFAVLMIVASISMIRTSRNTEVTASKEHSINYSLLMAEGVLIGVLAGMVGAGGGFLIIPALVLLSKLPMKQAIGTSLLIIAANSLIGFTGDLGNTHMNWPLMLSISALAIAGIFIGSSLIKKISAESLKKGFGWFVLVIGMYIIIKELFFP